MLQLQEEGKLVKLKNKWWKIGKFEWTFVECNTGKIDFTIAENGTQEEEEEEEEDDNPDLEMESVIGCFLVLLAGVGISFLLGCYEFFWHVHRISVEHKVKHEPGERF